MTGQLISLPVQFPVAQLLIFINYRRGIRALCRLRFKQLVQAKSLRSIFKGVWTFVVEQSPVLRFGQELQGRDAFFRMCDNARQERLEMSEHVRDRKLIEQVCLVAQGAEKFPVRLYDKHAQIKLG